MPCDGTKKIRNFADSTDRHLSVTARFAVCHVSADADEREDTEHEGVPKNCPCQTPLSAEVVGESQPLARHVIREAVRRHASAGLQALEEDHHDNETDDGNAEAHREIDELGHTTVIHSRKKCFLFLFCHIVVTPGPPDGSCLA